MNDVLTDHKRRKKRFFEVLGLYLWTLPALVLIITFLVWPTLQTIRLSLHEEVTFSEHELTRNLMAELKTESGMEVRRSDLIHDFPGWERAVQSVLSAYDLEMAGDQIGDTMTVRDTAQMLTMAITQQWQAKGRQERFVGLKNYLTMVKDQTMQVAFKNNLLWLIVFTVFTVVLGLLIATLTERVRWATLGKTIIFIPMAISGVASGVIWNFMYFKDVKTGTINALLNLLPLENFQGIAFLGRPDLVNVALIAAAVWMQVGFCTVIFSAALKAVPVELLEMARIEGAKNVQIFFRIEIPLIFSTIVVVITQMIIWVLKVFDIIYTLTKGGPFHSSEVVANRMYMTAFNENNFQYAAAMAVVLFIAVIPVLVLNIRNLAYEESIRE
jgi:alpha-glucoside transport system permease protein